MIIIAHRINKLNLIKKIPKRFGVEIDLRSYKKKIILNHEPFKDGVELNNFLKFYKHQILIVNIKEAGIENNVIQILKQSKIKNYFLLDVEQPFIWSSVEKKFKNIAIRFSESEDIKNAKQYIGKFKWIWIDTKTKFPVNKKNYKIINKFKSCLVCPERWGRPKDIIKYKKIIFKNSFNISAVMTDSKYLNLWEK
tara:strand:- start:28007 stop:28591 length:585 start_codon:yes stop_codon:yes gene_type:complete